jgi:hypothetical protein
LAGAAAAPVSPAQTLKETMELFALMRGAAGDFFPGGNGKQSDLAGVIDAAKPLLGAIAERMAHEHQAPPAPAGGPFVPPPAPRLAVVPPVPRPAASPVPPVPDPPLSADDEAKKMMSLTLAVLCDRAAKKGNPEVAADFLFDGMSDDDLDNFADLLEMPNWFELLAVFHKPVENYREWFTALRAACLAGLAPPADDTAAATGDKKPAG